MGLFMKFHAIPLMMIFGTDYLLKMIECKELYDELLQKIPNEKLYTKY